MRYRPAQRPVDGRAPSLLRLPTFLRLGVAAAAATAIALMPALFVATPAQAVAGAVTVDSDLEANENDSFVFDVRREGGSGSSLTLNYDTVAATGAGVHGATPDVDFTRIHGQTTFQASNNNVLKRFTVNGLADALDEYDEAFTLEFRDPANNNLVASATGVLDDINATPSYQLSVSPDPVPEANHSVRVTATLSATTGRDVAIPISTSDGTASSSGGEDYTATSTTITVPSGSNSAYTDIPITDDQADDLDIETFSVAGSSGDNGQANTGGNATVRIADDDPTPSVSVGSASVVAEGSNLVFPITLSAPSHLPITVRASTSDGTASAADYTAVTNQLISFAPGETSKNVTVGTVDDTLNETQETVRVTLSGPSNAVAGTTTALGAINDTPDTPPGVTMDPSSVTEGDSGSVVHTFNVHLDADSGRTVRVGYQVNPNTATAADFQVVDQGDSGVLTFAPGDRLKTFSVRVFGDTIHEGNEAFTVVLTDLDTALTAGGALTSNSITITDDDSVPALQAIPAVSRAEGNAPGTLTMRVSVSNPDKNPIVLSVSSQDGSATSTGGNPGDNDYSAPAASATIAAGATYVDIPIAITGDQVYEGDESATISVDSTDATGGPRTGTFTITDDDPMPTVALSSQSGAEGTSLPVTATVTGVAQHALPITLTAVGASTNGSSPATLNDDFDPSGLSASQIPAGDQTQSPVPLGTIALLDDTVDEPDQTIRVSLSGVPNTAPAYQTITDDPNDLAPEVTVGDAAATEAGGTLNAPIHLDFSNAGNLATSTERTVVVHYRTDNGTATAPADFTAVTDATVTFAPGDLLKNAPITLLDDNLYELDETFGVTATSATPADATIALATGTETIHDSSSASRPSFSVGNVTRAENATGTADFTVTLSRISSQPVSFTVATRDGTAQNASGGPGADDYDSPGSMLTIGAGALTGVIHVPVNPDTVFETDETAYVDVSLANGETGAVGGTSTGTLTITNDDAAPTLTLPTATVAEGASLTVDAVVTGVAQNDLHYGLALSGDSANGHTPAGAGDYTDSGQQATLPGGTASGSHVTLRTVPILDDTVDEADETLKVVVSDGGQQIAAQTYTITDDPNDLPPSVSIDDVAVNEGAGIVAHPTISLTFAQNNGAQSTERTISVPYSTEDVTATAGSDYTAAAGGAVATFNPGTTSVQLSVPIIDDSAYEPDETFRVRLGTISPAGAATMADDTGVVTINENDTGAKPTWTLSGNQQVAENVAGGVANYTIQLSGPSTIGVTFTVGMTNGTAVDGGTGPGSNDFDPPPTTVTIPAGQTTATVPVTINNDSVYEQNEYATLSVALANGQTGATGPSPQTSQLTIGNDDARPTITLNQSVTQAEGTTVTVTATQQGQAQAAVTFGLVAGPYSGGGSDPAENSDYTVTQTSGTIPAGSVSGTVTTLGTITLNNDTVDENTEAFAVTATDQTGDLSAATAVYRISDDPNDLPPSVALGNLTVGENAGTAHVPVTLSFGGGNGATSTERDTVLTYRTTDGTATGGSDFTATTSGQLTIPAASASGTIDVPITDDTVYENDETFTVTVLSHTPSEAAVTPATATVTISRNDTDQRGSYTVAGVSRNEDAQTPTAFVIQLEHVNTADVTFTATMTPGTATTGGSTPGSNDYSFTNPGTITIPAGQLTASIPVSIIADQVYEPNETATVRVSLATNETNLTGGPVDATLTIVNDEATPHLTLNTGESGTEGTDLALTGSLDRQVQAATVFSLAFAGDSTNGNIAAGDSDYVVTGGSATVPAGTPAGTAVTLRTIRLANDKVDEPIETVKATATDQNGLVPAATGLYQINDDPNDMPPSVSLGDATVGEGAGNARVPVTLAFDAATNDATSTTRPVTVNYTLSGGTATATTDFAATAGQVIVAPGDLTQQIDVPIVDDHRDEPDETFTVNVSTVTPTEARIAGGTATVTIQDNDANQPKPGFSVADVSQAEGNAAGSATFTVRLDYAAQDAVTFDVSMADGTATDAVSGLGSNDYNPPASRLTIPQGQTSGTVTVPVNGDTVYEPDETATLTVGLAAGERDATGDPSDATLTLQNDDAVPTVELSSASGTEGDEIALAGRVTGSTQDDTPITIAFSGDDSGTNVAADDTDYDTSGVTPVIPAGTTNGARIGLGSVELSDDTIDEYPEFFKAVTGGRTTSYRIFDDPADQPPTVSVSDETIHEDEDSIDLEVSLNFPGGTTAAGYDIVVPWSTVDGTARAGQDYTAQNSSTIIEAGNPSSTINVPITDDPLVEGTQSFGVQLGTPEPGTVRIADGTGTATIYDDDTATTPTLNAPASRVGAGPVVLSGVTNGELATVQLWAAPSSAPTRYTMVQTATAGLTGAYSFTRTISDGGYNFKVTANGQTSAVRTVQIQEVPVLAAVSVARGTATLTATGNPRTAGQTVYIQRLVNGAWVNVSTGKLGSAGTYVTVLRGLTSRTAYTYRAAITTNATLGILGGVSDAKRLIIA